MVIGNPFCFGKKRYQFHFRVSFFVLTTFFFVLFCYLGIWQFHRYQYKKNLLKTYYSNLSAQPIPFKNLIHSQQNLAFRKVTVTGNFDSTKSVLIQNQMRDGKAGYEVLTPFKVTGEESLLLIDRGWSPKSNVPPVQPGNQITGYIKFQDEHQFILGKNTYSTQFPLVMQKIDLNELQSVTHQRFFPFIVRLIENMPDGLNREWVLTTLLPEKHLGYCIQWFLMALVILIAYVCFCCESIKNEIKT